jgi:hypothetical protein
MRGIGFLIMAASMAIGVALGNFVVLGAGFLLGASIIVIAGPEDGEQ